MSGGQSSVSDFKSSMSFLIDSMLETLTYLSRGRIMLGKQPYHVQTEKFSSFYDKVSEDETLLQNLQAKVVVPVFNTHSMSFLNSLVGADGALAAASSSAAAPAGAVAPASARWSEPDASNPRNTAAQIAAAPCCARYTSNTQVRK